MIDSASLVETFEKASLKVSEFTLSSGAGKVQAFNAIDNRDLADVYLSSSFNEPSSADVANLVKKFVVEGSIQSKVETRPPIKPVTDPSAVVPSTVLNARIEEPYGDLCSKIASFSLDSRISTLWRMRQAVLNKMQDAIKSESSEEKKKSIDSGEGKKNGENVWNITPMVFNPTAVSSRHEHTLNLVPESRRSHLPTLPLIKIVFIKITNYVIIYMVYCFS